MIINLLLFHNFQKIHFLVQRKTSTETGECSSSRSNSPMQPNLQLMRPLNYNSNKTPINNNNGQYYTNQNAPPISNNNNKFIDPSKITDRLTVSGDGFFVRQSMMPCLHQMAVSRRVERPVAQNAELATVIQQDQSMKITNNTSVTSSSDPRYLEHLYQRVNSVLTVRGSPGYSNRLFYCTEIQ